MITKKRMFASSKGVNIYQTAAGERVPERGDYTGSIPERSSLLVLLPLFRAPVDEILASIKVEECRIEEILPLNERLLFLLVEMISSFWMNLVGKFLLHDTVNAKLHVETLDSLRNPELVRWLPQQELHLVRKLAKRYARFWS